MNPDKPPRKPIVDMGGTSMLVRGLIFAGLIIFIIILFSVGMSFLNRSSNAQAEKLKDIVSTQNEIVRISEAAEEKITDKDLLYRTLNTKISVGSSQQELTAALSKRKVKIDEKSLGKTQNSENDAILVKGEQSGKFNETYKELLDKQLSDYQTLLQSAYEGSNKTEKEVIQKAFNQLRLLNDQQ